MRSKSYLEVMVTNIGSHIFGLTNFPDFSSIFSIFQYSSAFYVMNLTSTKIYLTNTLHSKIGGKKIAKIPWLFQYFPGCQKFSDCFRNGFLVHMRTMNKLASYTFLRTKLSTHLPMNRIPVVSVRYMNGARVDIVNWSVYPRSRYETELSILVVKIRHITVHYIHGDSCFNPLLHVKPVLPTVNIFNCLFFVHFLCNHNCCFSKNTPAGAFFRYITNCPFVMLKIRYQYRNKATILIPCIAM